MSATAIRSQATNMRIAAYRAGVVQRAYVATNVRTRAFQTTAAYGAGKESAEGSEARKEEIEREKQQQLKEQKEGKAEWKQSLASDSESITKADRGEMNASTDSIKKLQEESAKAAQREKKQ